MTQMGDKEAFFAGEMTHDAVGQYLKLPNCVSPHQTLLCSQLEMEKMKVEQERKKAIFTQEAVKEKVLNCVGLS